MSIAWERAYLAYLDSGLSKAEFYRTRLIEFSSDGCIYKRGYLYTKFSHLSKTIIQNDESVESTDDESSEMTPIPVRPIGSNVFVAGELSQTATGSSRLPANPTGMNRLSRGSKVGRGIRRRTPHAAAHIKDEPLLTPKADGGEQTRKILSEKIFRIRMPNGVELSFPTKSPEILAMQMLYAEGRHS